ncbi:MAG: DUF4837 family protein [Bacteroidetes bacterium]|jgi:hypothetical protein|nr:DUF4837 family protein [Bacteroidota bacterium]
MSYARPFPDPTAWRGLRAFLPALLAGVVLLMGLTGCGDTDYRPLATGPEGQVTVVMDSTRWNGTVGEAVRANIAPYLSTLPAPERAFDLRQISLTSERVFDNVKTQKNVVFIAPLSDSTREASFMRTRLSREAEEAVRSGQTAVVAKPDLWRRQQRIFFVTAASPQGIIDALQSEGRRIRDSFHDITLVRMQDEMFEKERQRALEDSLLQQHGFAVNVQHDYQIAIDTTSEDRGFVWLRRILSDTRRGLFVYYEDNVDPSQLSPEWVYATRDSLTKRYLQGNVGGFVKIDYRRPLNTRNRDFLGRYAFITRGLWYMVGENENGELFQYGGGGPFVNYAFYDQEQDRVYMIDGMVFAPGYDKRSFLRQMEVIAQTFRTRTGSASQQTVAARSE